MELKTLLLDEQAIGRAMKRIAHEIAENNKGVKNVVLLGIAKGGIPVCECLSQNILQIENIAVPTAKLDVSLYRDDKKVEVVDENLKTTLLDISLQDKDVVLCDDVLYTGRTVRAGIEAIFKMGRPRSIQLAVLIDRGHRELPIRADYVGKNVPTSKDEIVSVTFDKVLGNKAVILG